MVNLVSSKSDRLFLPSLLSLPKADGREATPSLLSLDSQMVCPANIGERAGAMGLLESLKYPLSRLQKILVDKGFSGEDITQWVKDNFDCIWEVSTRAEEQKGFVVESKALGSGENLCLDR